MKLIIASAGKPALGYAREGIELYLNRIKPFCKVEMATVRDGTSEEVSSRLLQATRGCLRIALDERGQRWTTERFCRHVRDWQLHSVKKIAFLIGASDGHTQALRDECEVTLALSEMTMQHELAQLVLLEQLYRIHTIIAGTPYHRQ